MAGKIRYLHYKRGRYSARLVVPVDLRPLLNGKTELTKALGADRRAAIKALPGAVAQLQGEIARAERRTQLGASAPRYPMPAPEIAASHYARRLALDEELRGDWRYASGGYIDDQLVADLRDAVAGKLSDTRLQAVIGDQVERYRALGNLDATAGSDEWRGIARALCVAELEALARVAERDDGNFTGKPDHPLIVNATPPADQPEPVNLALLWNEYVASRKQAGFMRDGGQRSRPAIESLRKFLKHADAARVTRKDLLAWRDELLKSLSAKTVSDIYLSAVRAMFKWAHENERLPDNPALTVRQPKPRSVKSREKGYTTPEATAVLQASRNYQPKADPFGKVREQPKTTALKVWGPILCAFSGARVSEIAQLRKEDVRQEGDRWVIRITPDAGTVKAGGYRDVPLHRQIVALGFLKFVDEAASGPLFHFATDPAKAAGNAARQSERIAVWLQEANLVPAGVAPSHAWRHRFKTQARELGLSDRVADAIQGHAGKTASDDYGDVSLIARSRLIDALPDYSLS